MYFSPLQLFVPAAFIHSGLRNGRSGAWAAVGGATFILSMATLAYGSVTPIALAVNVAALLRFLLEVGLPAALAMVLIRREASFGVVLTASIAASVAGFGLTELAMREIFNYSPYQAIVGNFRSASGDALAAYRQREFFPEDAVLFLSGFFERVAASFMPVLMVIVAGLMFTLSLVMIPRLPAGRATGSTYLLRSLVLPEGLLFLFVASGLASLAPGTLRVIGLNVLGAVVFLYLLQGLAIFRSLLVRFGFGPLGVLTAYVTLAILTIYGVALFALFLAGLFDPFFDFRKLKRKEDSDESDTD